MKVKYFFFYKEKGKRKRDRTITSQELILPIVVFQPYCSALGVAYHFKLRMHVWSTY